MISENSDLHDPGTSDIEPEATPPPAQKYLGWPPPGLERIQGSLLPAAGFIGLGGLVLILPLLVSIGIRQSFTSFGPFGARWWVMGMTTGLGLILLLDGFHRFFHILRTGNIGMKQGHGWLTIAQVACDTPRDMGFLLQGARGFATLDIPARQAIMQSRLLGLGCYLAAGLWLLLGFFLSIFFAARGLIGHRTLWIISMGPSLALFFTAIFFRMRGALLTRRPGQPDEAAVRSEISVQVSDWIGQADNMGGSGALGRGPVHRALSLRVASIIAITIGLIMLIPLISFIFVGTYIPQMTNMIPRFQGVQSKAYRAEVVREYRPATDPAITAMQAGEALQVLFFAGSSRAPGEFQVAPVRRYDQGWQFGRNRSSREANGFELMETPTAELTREDWDILRSEAENPAHREFAILGRAAAADFGTAHWGTSFPDTLTWFDFPIPRFQGISDGAKSHVAVAAYDLHSGRRAAAEQKLRDLIGAGLLMMDEHPTLIGNLIGMVITGIGAEGLESLYRVTGETAKADRIRQLLDDAEDLMRSPFFIRSGDINPENAVREMKKIAGNDFYLRGLRWEFLRLIAAGAPFINLNKAVFGVGEDYEEWLDSMHRSLVRYPGEEAMFTMSQYGMVAPAGTQVKPGFFGRLLTLTFGKSESAASIAMLLSTR